MKFDSIFNSNAHAAARRFSLKSFFLSSALFAVSLVGSLAHAGFGLALSHVPGGSLGMLYTLTWTAVTPSTSTAKVTYFVFQDFGKDAVAGTGNLNNAIFSTDQLTTTIDYYVGSRCFVVASSDSVTGAVQFTGQVCHNFVHDLTSESILRADGDGTQRGVNQKWTFTYSLDYDAYVTAKIYPPGTQFTRDANNFIISASSPVIKTLVDVTPRSGELATHNITMSETWDSRTSTGAIVSNGIYYLLMSADLDTGYFQGPPPNESVANATRETFRRFSDFFSVPVDIIRIMNLAATGITQTNAVSKISYDLTGDCNIRVLIARPGSGFTIDSAGNIQAVNLTLSPPVIDNSLVVSSFTFQRKAGSNVESWDGTSSTGSVMTSGVYPVGLSGTDNYGNHAVDLSGNDFPIFTTIALERSAGSSSGPATAADTTPPTIKSITPANGSTSNSAVTSIVVQLADADSSINLSGGAVTVRDPNNTAVPGVLTNNGTDTLTFTPTTAMGQSGTYTATVVALDPAGNSATYTQTFTVSIRLDSSALESSLTLFPNPAKNTTATIQYSLSVAATTDIDIFNILGERVFSTTFSDTQGTATHVWNVKNGSDQKVGSGLYLVRIRSTGSGSKAEAIKKLVVIQ